MVKVEITDADGKAAAAQQDPATAPIDVPMGTSSGAGSVHSLRSTSSFSVADDFGLDDFMSSGAGTPPGEYGQVIPDVFNTKVHPPALPPHLLQVTLNSEPLGNDPTQYVVLCCRRTAKK